jgi:hypothetical protein
MQIRTIRVEPIYGYGWVTASDHQTRDVPSVFDLNLGLGETLCGTVLTPGHEFEGALVLLTPRHTEHQGLFNVEVKRGVTLIANGYARLQ